MKSKTIHANYMEAAENSTFEIPLTRGAVAIVDKEDFERLSRHKWFLSNKGYAVRTVTVGFKKKATALMHRVILGVPPEMETDHRNRNRLDNRRQNLRVCSFRENAKNRTVNKNSRSGIKGVYWHRARETWVALIGVNGRRLHLGCFPSKEAAASAYEAAARLHHGEFAAPSTQSK